MATYRMVDAMATAWNFLAKKSVKPIVAAGIMGNIYEESKWNIEAEETESTEHHFGLCQWDGNHRWPRFKNQGRDPKKILDHLEYMWWELQNDYKSMSPSTDDVMNSDTVESATKNFHDCYERSGEANWAKNGPVRIQRAKEAYEHFVNKVELSEADYPNITVSEYDPTGITTVDPQKLGSGGAASFSSKSSTGTQLRKTGTKPTPQEYIIYNGQKLVKNKTPCVPVYPDIISVYNQIPDWAMKDSLGEEFGTVEPPSGHANKYKKVKSKMTHPTGGTSGKTTGNDTNSSTSGTKGSSTTTNNNKPAPTNNSSTNAHDSTKIDNDHTDENIDELPTSSDDSPGKKVLNNIGKSISEAWENYKKTFETIHSTDTNLSGTTTYSVRSVEPVPINPGAPAPGEGKNPEVNKKDKSTTTKEQPDASKKPNPTISTNNIPQSAYEQIDNEYGCFNVVLPAGAIAKYGNGDAKDALKYVQTLAQRQIRFNPKEHSNAIKAPFPGRVQNNNDPFPVDLRIRDLEMHNPRIVIDSINGLTEFETATAKALLELGADTEKRVVQIENHLATTMRYLFRLASIVPINDIYYGGNSLYEKYHGIRQLDDLLINDGFQTQIDQYLTSTRIEPIVGQVYELLNQVGANLSVILDDNQMAYSNMEHYVKLNDITQYQEPLKMANIHEAASLTKDPNDKVLNENWDDGFVMDWTLIPVEQQTPLINWRQSIIDDGAALMNSAPLYGTGDAAGVAMTGDAKNNIFYKTAVELSGSSNADIIKMVKAAEDKVKEFQDVAENIAKSKEVYTQIRNSTKGSGLPNDFSTPVIATLMCMKDTNDFTGVISKLKEVQNKLKEESSFTNSLLIALAYLEEDKYVIGDKPTKDPTDKKAEHEELKTRLDFVYKTKKTESSSENGSGGGVQKIYFNLTIGDEAKWTFSQIMEPYSINCHEKREEPVVIDPKIQSLVTLCICYRELSKKFKSTEFDNEQWGFFIGPDYIERMKITGFPGEQRSSHTHEGFDIVIVGAEEAGERVELLSPCDGYIQDSDAILGTVTVQSSNGTGAAVNFFHLKERFVNTGDQVQKGTPLGIVGGIGYSTSREYDEHIHVELWPTGYRNYPYGFMGDCYPGIFQDYCQDAVRRRIREWSQGPESYFKDFGK